MERICPVLTSITTAVPLTAFDDSIALASACSDSYCSWVSNVSSSPVPGVVATWFVTGDCGRATPAGDSMIVSLPAVPASWLVVAVLEPGCALTGGVGEPDDGCGQVPVGNQPLGVVDQRDAGDGVRRDLLARRLGQLAGQHHVAGPLVELGRERRGGDAEQG